ncbi:MAG: biotin/lipoyl-containing protein [bacterium]
MKTEFQIAGETAAAEWSRSGDRMTMRLLERELQVEILRWAPPFFSVRHCSHVVQGAFYRDADFVDVHLPKGNFRIRLAKSARGGRAGHAAGGLSSPMPGKVVKVFVKTGDQVKKGDLLMMLEAMKMEHKILSPKDGVVGKIAFQEGERVGQDVDLLEIQ